MTQAPLTAALLRIEGTVQGVGFRPFLYRLAARHGLAGWVRNRSGDVEVMLEGAPHAIEQLLAELRIEAPPLSHIASVDRVMAVPAGLADFTILPSEAVPGRRQPVSPDVSLCENCAAELRQPDNRRFGHPFITCTDCGPRISIIEDIPYDRRRTTMGSLPQCERCRAEYLTPGNRRHHSETNSCPECGPMLSWQSIEGQRLLGAEAALNAAAAALRTGRIVALLGVGGYHLAVDATDETAVAELRRRKRRNGKPFAVMVTDLRSAEALARLAASEARLLAVQQRPIVVVRQRSDSGLAKGVAPGLASVGLMLPYSPLHLLLLERVGRPLVMTSANLTEEPLVAGVEEARQRLCQIADGFLDHDRRVSNRHDDSVARVTAAGGRIVLRRARGYSPAPLSLPVAAPLPLLAVGPHLKNTITLAAGNQAFTSQHLGDLESLPALLHWRETVERYRRLFRIEPEAVAHDLHPGYLSTRLAEEMELPRVAVQHHHAHVAAVLGEHGLTGPVIGVAFDGTGYGDDGTIWGSEILIADLVGYRRFGHLKPVPLPGGDVAAKNPWRSSAGYAFSGGWTGGLGASSGAVPEADWQLVWQQLRKDINCPLASSMGRLFDAAASIIGLRHRCSYEGEAAQALEESAGTTEGLAVPLVIEPGQMPPPVGDGSSVAEAPSSRLTHNGTCPHGDAPAVDRQTWQWDGAAMLGELDRLRDRGVSPDRLAATLHDAVARATLQLVHLAREETGLELVALGGGTFQNARLHHDLGQHLLQAGFQVLQPRDLSPNDGAISYGQAVVAAARLSLEE